MATESKATKLIIRILLFLVWLLLGAGLFLGVEKPHETRERAKLNFLAVTANFTAAHNISEGNMTRFLKKLQKAVDLGYDIGEQNFTIEWDFMNAFFFAGNVVTTIGYGHIVPATVLGRMLCIIYALVGIPITGLTLRSVGNKISEQISKLIKLFERKVYNRESDKLELKTAGVAFLILILIIVIPAAGFSSLENWTYEDSVYFCFITLTTIGFGDFVPGQLKLDADNDAVKVTIEFLNLIYMVVGLAVMSGVIVSISGVIEEKTKGFHLMGDPLETLNLNLNNRALKKLGIMGGNNTRNRDEARPPTSRTPKQHYVPKVKGRSISAEKVHFQGPTPIMQLSNASNDGGSAVSPKRFQNKVEPLSEPVTEMAGAVTNPDVQEQLESLSFGEVSDYSENSRRNSSRRESGRPNSSLKERLAEKRESKNELIVEVQLTPLPTPRSSPVSFQVTTSKELETNDEQSDCVANAEKSVRADAMLRKDSDLSETQEILEQTAKPKMKDTVTTINEPTSGQELNGVDESTRDHETNGVDEPTGSHEINRADKPTKSHEINGVDETIRDHEMNGLHIGNKTLPVQTVEKPSKKLNGVASQTNKKGKLQEQRGRKNIKNR